MKKKIVPSKLVYLGIALCLLASMAIFGWAKETPAQPSGPRYGGILRVADLNEGISIGYPPKLVATPSIRQAAPAIETLLRTDERGQPAPWLATGFKENAKAKTITLTLRKGVKFHDDTDFNAEAVKWNLEQFMSQKHLAAQKFRSIDVVDDYTIRINLSDWDSTITSSLSLALGMMISPTAYKKNGEEWCSNNPVGTGPFQFVSWKKEDRTTYKKFDGYWQKGKPYLDGIEYIVINDPLTRELSLRKGELDLMETLEPRGIGGLEKDGYLIKGAKQGSGAKTIIPDSANPKSPWADVRVRQAAQYAIDPVALNKAVFYGRFEPTNQYGYKGHWGYNPSVVGYLYNPTKAKQLLTEAGYPNGFKTKLTYWGAAWELTYTAVQGYLEAVGIHVEMNPMDQGGIAKYVFGTKWEGLLVNRVLGNPDVLASLAQLYSGGNAYISMLVPDDYAKAIQNAIAAPDFKTKQKWVHETMKLMIDKYCLQIVIYAGLDFGVSKYAHNHGMIGTNTALWTPEDAWLEK